MYRLVVCGHLAGLTKEHNFVSLNIFFFVNRSKVGIGLSQFLTQAKFCLMIAIMKERKDAEKAGSGQPKKSSA